jgi:hypothetical protein
MQHKAARIAALIVACCATSAYASGPRSTQVGTSSLPVAQLLGCIASESESLGFGADKIALPFGVGLTLFKDQGGVAAPVAEFNITNFGEFRRISFRLRQAAPAFPADLLKRIASCL